MDQKQIERLSQQLASSDAIVIGAGAGLSTSAGFTYTGERFEYYFPDFIAKYHFSDMYSGGFYPFDTLEEHWAYWSRYIFCNCYLDAPKLVYQELLSLVQDKRDAVEGKFDILLVYMFDRLGRKDDETPFIVEWFVRNGVEVWSATEGQQRFDNHVDKLLNYIRYWQASGESIKTSVRTKTRLEQLTESGFYTGGSIAYADYPADGPM